jgi:hypothetical protein
MMRADQSAPNLLMRSGFNVNSTSVNAWKVMLSGITQEDPGDGSAPFLFRGNATHARGGTEAKPLYIEIRSGLADIDGAAPLRNAHFQFAQNADSIPAYYSSEALKELSEGGSSAHKEFQQVVLSQGVRELEDDQVDAIAKAVVEEIEDYAAGNTPYEVLGGKPFMGVRDFMSSGILDRILNPDYTLPGGVEHPNEMVRLYPYAPAYLSQAQILSGVSHLLTSRSDTFLIRGYGDSRNPVTGRVNARADCEMIVQRVRTSVSSQTSKDRTVTFPYPDKGENHTNS